jgi:hypothetical protein
MPTKQNHNINIMMSDIFFVFFVPTKQKHNINMMRDCDDDDDDILVAMAVMQASLLVLSSGRKKRKTVDHRSLPRKKRTIFKHQRAKKCIVEDYLSPDSLFGKDFALMFRISRPRFQRLMEDVKAQKLAFYDTTIDRHGNPASSLEAKLLLPLKALAYGVTPNAFRDYFQMSQTSAAICCTEFDNAIKACYMQEYLRLPTKQDLRGILKLHKEVHHVDGMFGSLDCCHTYWKNCPKAWQGSFKGKENKPSIVLEGIVDYHLFFWHCSYGYAGTLNDRNILNLSPFYEGLLDGTFETLEKEAAVVPFKIGEEEFDKLFFLGDDIYPSFARIVKGIKQPITELQKLFTGWQEGARKDIERAFGVLKGTWQFTAKPIQLRNLKKISNRVTTCLILHNILVSDRVMGGPEDTYDPSFSVLEEIVDVQQPRDLLDVQARSNLNYKADVHPNLVTRRDRWLALSDTEEHRRLYCALLNKFGNKNTTS